MNYIDCPRRYLILVSYDLCSTYFRAVERSENSGVPVLFGGHKLPPMVEIGLTDLPKRGGHVPLAACDRPEQ